MIRPYTTLYLLLWIFGILLSINLLFSSNIQLGTFSINLIDFKSFIPKEQSATVNKTKPNSGLSSVSSKENNIVQDVKPEVNDSVTTTIQTGDSIVTFQYPPNNAEAMNYFYQALNKKDSLKGNIRILHFGDSQIEGDRVSSTLRTLLQQRFGGCGSGLLPVSDNMNTRLSHKIRSNQEWNKITPLDKKSKKTLPYGIAYAVFERENLGQSCEISINKTGQASGNVARAEVFTLIRQQQDSLNPITVSQNEKQLSTFYNDGIISRFQLSQPLSNKVKVLIPENEGKYLQGFSFECNEGIVLDNISLRGSSITEFTRMHRKNFQDYCKVLGVKLIILEFGVNVVPYVVDDYSHYEKLYTNQLLHLRKVLGNDISILVIGVSDMCRSVNGVFESYPNIGLVKNAQRNAAFKAGAVFWDLYYNMGGKNSMTQWVSAAKPLAGKDFTHFTPFGASKVADLIYKALITDYEKQTH